MNKPLVAALTALTLAGGGSLAWAQQAPNPVLRALETGTTTRTYAVGAVGQDLIDAILRAGIQAPSASDGQPWRFTVVRDAAEVTKIIPKAVEGNVLIILSAPVDRKPNTNVDFDCGLAMENLNLAAQSLGLGAHIYTSPIRALASADRLRDLKIPAGFQPVAVLRVGLVDKGTDATASASTRLKAADLVN